ncbi:MAG TPA: alpha/beta fold hydrolase [Gemmatimonadota bacterium]|nr:alpha/beta fold hydrolase [Gemmatimonadota bacterium]
MTGEERRAAGAPAVADDFRPAGWLPGGHLQTLWSRVLRRGPRVALRRETWETPDGDELHLDRIDGPPEAPLLVALHGLEGCSDSLYMHGLLHHARARGWRGIALNFRSCARPEGGRRGTYLPNRADRLYHMGETSDLDWVLETLAAREPGAGLVVTGVSMGGNVLLKWLGERGTCAPPAVRGAAAISTPYDLAAAADHLEKGLGPWYVRYFLGTLKRKALDYAARHPGVVDIEGVRRARGFRTYDDAAVAPIHGFADAADYYARSSSLAYLARIRVPTLLVSAADDPFLPPSVLDLAARAAPPQVRCLFTAAGGHVGFVEGPPWAARSWAEARAVEFLAECLEPAG